MIEDSYNSRYYIYRHIRPDTNEIFYVGLGTVYDSCIYSTVHTEFYKRAFGKNNRNNIWNKIVFKNNGIYEVEIICHLDSEESANKKEREFIELYGRIDLGTGTLANLKDGGKDTTMEGAIRTKEWRNNISIALTGKKLTEDHKRKWRESTKSILFTPVVQYDLDGNFVEKFDTALEASISIGNTYSSQILGVCKKNRNNVKCKEFMWRYFDGKIIEKIEPYSNIRNEPVVKPNYSPKKIIQLDDNKQFIAEFESLTEAERNTGISRHNIGRNARGRKTYAGGFKWEFKS